MKGRKAAQPRVSTHPVRALSASDRKLVARVRRICMVFPEANERISHGEPTWFAGKGRVFAMIDGHHHDSPHLSVWLPQSFDAQEALIGSDPDRYFKPAYVGVKGWVGVVLDTKPDWDVVAGLVRESYLRVASAKQRKQLEAG
jgi:predicted DNA-binding protein (MmcQ/YjbR family)